MGKGGGKGRGKGGDNIISEGFGCLHQITSCICCLLLVGPVLTIVGVVFLASSRTDTRGASISKFNTYVNTWSNDTQYGYKGFVSGQFSARATVQQAPGQSLCPSALLTLSSSAPLQLPNPGATDIYKDTKNGVNSGYTQYKFSGQLPSSINSAKAGCRLLVEIFNKPAAQVATTDSPMATSPADFTTTVTYSRSDLNCGSSSSGNHKTSCSSACSSKQGTYSSSTQLCTVAKFLAAVCVKVTPEAGQTPGLQNATAYQLDNTKPASGDGCYWGSSSASRFVEPSYITSAGSISVIVRSSQDPYLEYMALTSGSGDFGLTQSQKRAIGVSCLIIGIIFLLAWVAVCTCACMAIRGIRKQKPPPTNPVQAYFHAASHKYGPVIGYPVVAFAPPPTSAPPTAAYPQAQYAQGQYPQGPYMQNNGMPPPPGYAPAPQKEGMEMTGYPVVANTGGAPGYSGSAMPMPMPQPGYYQQQPLPNQPTQQYAQYPPNV